MSPSGNTTSPSLLLSSSRLNAPKAETRPLLDHFEYPAFPGKVDGEYDGEVPVIVADWEVVGYSVVIPIICAVGIVANSLSILVLVRGAERLKESLYTYLKVLSAADLITVTLVLLSGLARGVWRENFFWRCFDAFVHLPVGSVTTTISIVTLMAVTVERVAVIRAPVTARRLYCTPTRARNTCVGVLCFAVVFSVPYCLTYTVREGRLTYSEFTTSRYYAVHNWMRLVALGLLPGITLLLGNLLLLYSLRHPRTSLLARPRNPNMHNYQRRLTWVLVAMIASFLVGEFPTHVASRASATSLLFPGRPQKLNTLGFRIFKLTVTILMSLHYSCNFFLYCAFNKRFSRELSSLIPSLLLSSRQPPPGVTRVGPLNVARPPERAIECPANAMGEIWPQKQKSIEPFVVSFSSSSRAGGSLLSSPLPVVSPSSPLRALSSLPVVSTPSPSSSSSPPLAPIPVSFSPASISVASLSPPSASSLPVYSPPPSTSLPVISPSSSLPIVSPSHSPSASLSFSPSVLPHLSPSSSSGSLSILPSVSSSN